jgi:hypothetical protein
MVFTASHRQNWVKAGILAAGSLLLPAFLLLFVGVARCVINCCLTFLAHGDFNGHQFSTDIQIFKTATFLESGPDSGTAGKWWQYKERLLCHVDYALPRLQFVVVSSLMFLAMARVVCCF